MHHLALRTPDPSALADFYARALDLREIRRNVDDDGIRSVWLDLDGAILMLERGRAGGSGAGWDGLFIQAQAGSGQAWADRWRSLDIVGDGSSAYSLYAVDPEGNRFGVSSFPRPLF